MRLYAGAGRNNEPGGSLYVFVGLSAEHVLYSSNNSHFLAYKK